MEYWIKIGLTTVMIVAISGMQAKLSCHKAIIDGKVCGKKICPINDSCEDTSVCPCMDGYRSFNETRSNRVIITCEDKLECVEGTHACGANTRCDNTDGGYYCVCNKGFHRGNTTLFCPTDNKAENVCSGLYVSSNKMNEISCRKAVIGLIKLLVTLLIITVNSQQSPEKSMLPKGCFLPTAKE
ncbi:collagen and calcium-binding EGF domain-containing protein 1-like [Mantella aurantiaca]